jgi:hypothetical protein
MVDQIPDHLILKVCEYLPGTEIVRVSVADRKLLALLFLPREEYRRDLLVEEYRVYYSTARVDPEIAFGPIPDHFPHTFPENNVE